MIIPIRCFTCGKVLADKYDYYVAEAEKLLAGDSNTDAAKTKPKSEAAVKHFDNGHTGKIMDKIGLTRYCCRRHMLSQVDLMDTI